ncbi:MAG: PKD domain-containing protein [Methanobacteriota archaeon]
MTMHWIRNNFLVKTGCVFILFSLLISSLGFLSFTGLSDEINGHEGPVGPLDDPVYEIIITPDQHFYYPGEQVLITIQLLKNGVGYPGGLCPEVRDPEDNMIYGGLCYPSDENGFLYINDFYLDVGAILGTYLIYVHWYADGSEGSNTTTFEVVSETILADAHGPYEAFVGEPIQFTGSASGGKPGYTWLWEFGNGDTSTEQNPLCTYPDEGTFPVHLTVTDTGDRTGDDTTSALIYGQESGYLLFVLTDNDTYLPGETVIISGRLTDNGVGISCKTITIEIMDPFCQLFITLAALTNASGYYTYSYDLPPTAPPGVYRINAFIILENNNVSATTLFTVERHVVVVYAGGSYEGLVDHVLAFHGTATGGIPPYSWEWVFSDGTNASGQDITHVFDETGTFTVNLTVVDAYNNSGNDSATILITSPAEATHIVFIEEATAGWCSNCPAVAEILHDLYGSEDYRFYYVSLVHDENEKAKERLNESYNIYAFPSVYIDGGYKVIVGQKSISSFQQNITAAMNRDVPKIQVTLNVTYNTTTKKFTTNVTVSNGEATSYTGSLKVYLTEKVSRWADYNGKAYSFGFLDFIINKDIIIPAGNSLTEVKQWDASALDPENLMVFAVVFNSETHQGYSQPPNLNPFNAHYADAVNATEVVKGGTLPPSVGFSYPKKYHFNIFGNANRMTPLQRNTIVIGKLTLIANASTFGNMSITSVQFAVDGTVLVNDTSSPYSVTVRKFGMVKHLLRRHTITATAFTNHGKSSTVSMDIVAIFL